LNEELGSKTNFSELKNKPKGIQYYFIMDLNHNNDEEDQLPIIKANWIPANPQFQEADKQYAMCIVSMNH